MAAGSSTSVKHPSTPPARKAFSARSAGWWALAALLLGVGVFFIVRASSDPEDELLAARRQQIEAMSPAERQRLEKNLERFEQLPPQRQETLRAIEKAASEDEGLGKTLADYERWLNTLSPWERMELRNAKTPEDKLQFVSAITTARKQEADESLQQQLQFEESVRQYLSRFQGQERRPEKFRVSDNQINNMMTALDNFGSRVKAGSKTSLPGYAAYNIQLLTEALKDQIQKVSFDKAKETPLPDSTVQKMIDRITDPKSHTHVQDIFDKGGSKGFVIYLVFKLEMAWWHEFYAHPPSKEELDEVAKTLGGNFMEEYEKRKKTDPRGAYMQLLIATGRANFQMDTKEFSELLDELGLRPFRMRPQGSGGRSDGGGFPGDNRGPRNDENDDRNRGERGQSNDDREDDNASRSKRD